MVLEEIFKDNPDLLHSNEVKKLIDYVEIQHATLFNIFKEKKEFEDKVIELVMESELILINGKDTKSTLYKILELIENS